MNLAKSTVAIYLLGFLGVFAWAALADPGLAGFLRMLHEPWGVAVSLDFVFGCLLLSWIIYCVEDSARVALAWAAALFIVGNIVGAIWFLTRFERIHARLAVAP